MPQGVQEGVCGVGGRSTWMKGQRFRCPNLPPACLQHPSDMWEPLGASHHHSIPPCSGCALPAAEIGGDRVPQKHLMGGTTCWRRPTCWKRPTHWGPTCWRRPTCLPQRSEMGSFCCLLNSFHSTALFYSLTFVLIFHSFAFGVICRLSSRVLLVFRNTSQ